VSGQLKEAFDILVTRSRTGDVLWRPTDKSDAISVSLPGGATVVIRNHDADSAPGTTGALLEALRATQQSFETVTGISLELRNVDSKTIDRLNISARSPKYGTAQELWKLAYDSAYRIGDTYDALRQALESPGKIGIDSFKL